MLAPATMPNLFRLHKQLHIDFAADTHGHDGEKRKREPTRSIYEEAAANFEKDAAERALRKKMRRKMKKRQQAKRRWIAKKAISSPKEKKQACPNGEASAEISEIDEESMSSPAPPHYNQEEQHSIMLHAAASLAQLGRQNALRMEEEVAAREKSATAEQHTMDAMLAKAHADALLAAKDDALRATTAALMAKEELVKLQATLISMMRQSHGNTAAQNA